MKHPLDPIEVTPAGVVPAGSGSFLQKHKVDGRAIHQGDRITVQVESFDGSREPVIRACLGHEVGHSIMLRTIEQNDMLKLDRFTAEVDAWHRFTWDAGNVPQDLDTGMLILDALNSYRRGYNVPDERWEVVRTMVCTWSVDSEALYDYEPLEPAPNEPPPGGCGGEPGQPGGLGTPSSDGDIDGGGEDTDEDADDGEEGGRDNGEGSGESDTDTGTGEGNAPNDEDEGSTKGRSGTQGTGGYGDGGDDLDDEGDDEPTEEDDRAADEELREERDRWLHQTDGITAAQEGQVYLIEELISRGWPVDDLPGLTKAILAANQ